MNNEEKADSVKPEDVPSTGTGSKLEATKLLEPGPEDANPATPIATKAPLFAEPIEQPLDADGSPRLSADREPRTVEEASSIVAKPKMAESPEAGRENTNPSVSIAIEKPAAVDADGSPSSSGGRASHTDEVVQPSAVESEFVKKQQSFFEEQPLPVIEMAPRALRYRTRREVLVFGIGAVAAAAGAGFLLPQNTLSRLGVRQNMDSPGKEWLLNKALRIDDDVAEALYSRNRMVPSYTKSQITLIKNNYNGATPDPGYISAWNLTLEGLASGLSVSLDIRSLTTRFSVHEQITRLVCVEGWSAIACWAGLRFDDLLRAYPPMSQAKWARVESSVNLDASGNPDPYFMSLDLATARHSQTLLATHLNGQPLTVDHGAPLRLLVPVKLGLKNVKAITRITFVAVEPRDYWAERGYSRYDGI
jgi:DMSO/TMAO reductase YedYZ molybdopterin-dependent catalytic subunit